ncbi:MAG: hypothetical protein M3N19_05510 [Candidatus Eremiobacteraeota bacterium]|nr:hypothetical protein [Candidatus Eremiobacteraeota bacterium]
MSLSTAHPEAGRMEDKVDELLNLIEIEPDALREAEFMQAQSILETMIGKTITSASIEDTRIVVSTSDGNKYFFYGFMGESSAA